MECANANGKRAEDAAGSSSGLSSASVIGERKEMPEQCNEAYHEHGREDEDDDDEEEEEEEGEEHIDDNKHSGVATGFVPSPLVSLKEQIEKDKEDESLRRWKEKLLGCLESDIDGQTDPDVKFHSIGIIFDDFGEIVTPLPVDENQKGHVLFTLREGSRYQLRLKFSVLHNIVSGLAYSNSVWKGRLQADQSKAIWRTNSCKCKDVTTWKPSGLTDVPRTSLWCFNGSKATATGPTTISATTTIVETGKTPSPRFRHGKMVSVCFAW